MLLNFPQITGSLCCNAELVYSTQTPPLVMAWPDKEGYAISKTYKCIKCLQPHSIELWYSLQTPTEDIK